MYHPSDLCRFRPSRHVTPNRELVDEYSKTKKLNQGHDENLQVYDENIKMLNVNINLSQSNLDTNHKTLSQPKLHIDSNSLS